MEKNIEEMTADEVVELNMDLIENVFVCFTIEDREKLRSAMSEVMENTTRWKRAHNS